MRFGRVMHGFQGDLIGFGERRNELHSNILPEGKIPDYLCTITYNFAKGTAALYGQCNDFSDFLVCASNAIGAKPLQSQRIIGPFHTNPITASPDPVFADAAFRPWNYHQFTGTTTFFDGCLRFQAYTTPANLPLLTYTNGLVAPGYIYTVLPLFTPIIATSRPIP